MGARVVDHPVIVEARVSLPSQVGAAATQGIGDHVQ